MFVEFSMRPCCFLQSLVITSTTEQDSKVVSQSKNCSREKCIFLYLCPLPSINGHKDTGGPERYKETKAAAILTY